MTDLHSRPPGSSHSWKTEVPLEEWSEAAVQSWALVQGLNTSVVDGLARHHVDGALLRELDEYDVLTALNVTDTLSLLQLSSALAEVKLRTRFRMDPKDFWQLRWARLVAVLSASIVGA